MVQLELSDTGDAQSPVISVVPVMTSDRVMTSRDQSHLMKGHDLVMTSHDLCHFWYYRRHLESTVSVTRRSIIGQVERSSISLSRRYYMDI